MEPAHLLEGLNEPQRDAVLHGEGPLLILAAAGSGKTRVITRRIAWLLHQGIHPQSLLAITFTNKAAEEMRKRVNALAPGNRVWISTFHSFGARILRRLADRLGLDKNFTIYDQQDRLRVIKTAMEDAQVRQENFSPEAIMGALSKAKNQLLSPDKYLSAARDFFTKTVAGIYPLYEKRLRQSNALDFDDLLYWPALALKNDPQIRAELDAQFQYILIDEYQDTNLAQYAIAKALSQDVPNLCVVGDPDQSIYKFRGSDIRNILDFERDFPNARVLTLGENYRSTPAILVAADTLIKKNAQRKHKPLFSQKEQGPPVNFMVFENGGFEADWIASTIQTQVRNGKRCYRDFAIFVRINALTRGLEGTLAQRGIPFQILRGLAFFERKEIRDLLAYLRLLVNPNDQVSFLRAVNEPSRGIGAATLAKLETYALERDISLLAAASEAEKIRGIKPKTVAALKDFALLIHDLTASSEQPAPDVIRLTLQASGYHEDLQRSSNPEDEERLANLEELITAAKQFTQSQEEASLAKFLESVSLASDSDSLDGEKDRVSIMTFHAAKGLEFQVVFMMALEQGILPHDRALEKEEEIEEERRLTFVGMTRAMEELHLSQARYREFRGQGRFMMPSIFLKEMGDDRIKEKLNSPISALDKVLSGPGYSGQIPKPISPIPVRPGEIAVGALVRHATYGMGRIIELGGHGAMQRVKIRFQTAGERSFIASKVALEFPSQC